MQKLDKSRLAANLGKRYKLVPFLDKALETFDKEWKFDYEPKRPDSAWHPSGQCTPQVSKLYEVAVEYTPIWTGMDHLPLADAEKLNAGTRKAFMVGHYWHQLLQHLVVELGFAEPGDIERKGERSWGEKEKMVKRGINGEGLMGGYIWKPKPFHWAGGSGDIAPCVMPKWQGIVDFKTMSSFQFKQTSLPEWVAFKYECQINMYMDFFDEENGLIVAINKDTPHDFKEFEFTRNQELIDAIYDKWKFVSDCIDHDIEISEEDDKHFILPGQKESEDD